MIDLARIKFALDIFHLWCGMGLIKFNTGSKQKRDFLYGRARGIVTHDRILAERAP